MNQPLTSNKWLSLMFIFEIRMQLYKEYVFLGLTARRAQRRSPSTHLTRTPHTVSVIIHTVKRIRKHLRIALWVKSIVRAWLCGWVQRLCVRCVWGDRICVLAPLGLSANIHGMFTYHKNDSLRSLSVWPHRYWRDLRVLQCERHGPALPFRKRKPTQLSPWLRSELFKNIT